MGIVITSLQTKIADNISRFEAKLNQTIPPEDKAFIVILATIMAIKSASTEKRVEIEARDNFILTASMERLLIRAIELGAEAQIATFTKFTLTIPAVSGSGAQINQGALLSANSGLIYRVDGTASEILGVITINATAEEAGARYNLNVGQTLNIVDKPVDIISTVATITVVTNIGADDEDIDDFRNRLLAYTALVTGGGNASDYKLWAEEVSGVKEVYCFAGKPLGEAGTSYPGDRTIWVECDESLDPDNIPDAALLAAVEERVQYDINGKARPPLGITAETLYVRAISRSGFDVEISDSALDASYHDEVEALIDIALDDFFRALEPYDENVKVVNKRNDAITPSRVGSVVEGIYKSYGASAGVIKIFLSTDIGHMTELTNYVLQGGEHAKLGATIYTHNP